MADEGDEIKKFLVSILTFIALMGHLGYDCYLNIINLCKYLSDICFKYCYCSTRRLPLAVTIVLTYSVGKLKDEQNLVKNLQSCEILDGAYNIRSDKTRTGTLKQNIMQVVVLWIENVTFNDQVLTNKNKIIKKQLNLCVKVFFIIQMNFLRKIHKLINGFKQVIKLNVLYWNVQIILDVILIILGQVIKFQDRFHSIVKERK